VQRILDITFSGLALLVLSPLLVIVAFALRLSGEGEIFYVQQRVGWQGKPFGLLKFATMLKNSPSLGAGTVTVKNDPRILPMGRFLRKTKINELPQLINIFLGDMSVIGPRPQTQRCFDVFLPESKVAIISVRPGLSGVGSIVFRDEENMLDGASDTRVFYDEVIAPYKGLLEEWYVRNQGVRTYFACIFVTVWIVVRPHSKIVWRAFPTLPQPPSDLRAYV
tara:strand:+ start:16150 stop:16815 length:666 start_codon:yes stop_codon:yes gene_type:complete